MAAIDQQNGSIIPADQSVTTRTTTVTEADGTVVTTKTVFITSSNTTDGVNTIQNIYNNQDSASTSDDSNITLVRRNSKRRSLNKEAYIKLHKNITNRKSIEVLKGKYEPQTPITNTEIDKDKINGNDTSHAGLKEQSNSKHKEGDSSEVIRRTTRNIPDLPTRLSTRLSKDSVELLKVKYSPSSFGYPNTEVAGVELREKPKLPEKPKRIPPTPPVRTSTLTKYTTQASYEFETQPAHQVILRSSSEDSIEKLESFMSEFTMDPKRETKEKKRTSSFRKILSGSLFSKDKKKGGDKKGNEEKSRSKKTENYVVADNVQNEETFQKNPVQRVSVDNHYTKQPKKSNSDMNGKKEYMDSTTNNLKEAEKKYAEMHINQFNRIKASFSNPETFTNHSKETYQYAHENDNTSSTIDKYIDTSSSSNTLESIDRSTYQNALIAQAELQQMREKELLVKQNNSGSLTKQIDNHRNQQTPSRAKETYQNVQLVKPKALIPINSERALPNPYHNGQEETPTENIKKSTERNLDIDEKDYATKIPMYNRQNDFNDVVYGYSSNKMQSYPEQRQYSPNLTKSSTSSSNQNSPSSPSFSPRSSPRSPTLEGSKLRLPSNREKVNLQPRIKSPIPQPKVSTEKIIATELLKNKTESKKERNEKLPPLNQQKLNYDYVDSNVYEPKPVNSQIVRQIPIQATVSKPPEIRSAADAFEAAKWHQRQRELANSPTLTESSQVLADVMVHADPNLKRNSLQYSSLPVAMRKPNQEVVNLRQRPVTPVKRVPSTASLQQSPQKHEIRQSVELYCWKEIQKMKEKQDQELKYQLQYTPYGYVEDPIIQRRSRSVEPAQQRNAKRSTSLPREVKSNANARSYYREPIPENSPIVYKDHDIYAQKNPNFLRNSPQRRTISTTSSPKSPQMYEGYYTNSGEVPYRPIFNRGSLNPQLQPDAQSQLQKKVSFNGNRSSVQQQSWPTRNGYVQSPPQRRIEKTLSVGDDEVFLRDSQIKQMNEEIQKQMVKDAQYSARDSITSLPRQAKPEESPYGTRISQIPVQNNVIYGSRPLEKNVNEPLYVTRQNKQNITELSKQKQENLQNIYGTKQQPDVDPLLVRQNYPSRNQELVLAQDVRDSGSVINEPMYGSQQQLMNERYYTNNIIAESPYGTRRIVTANPVTKVTKQVTITNKVCDFYGNIHENGNKMLVSPTSNAQIPQTGVIYGQLQGNVAGRPPQYQSYNQIPSNFVRGTRLTASANDMYRRYPNDMRYRQIVYEEEPHGQHSTNFNPNAPLPPTPNESKLQFLMMRRNNANKTYPHVSDTESDTSEVRRIMNRNYTGGNGMVEYRRPSVTIYETKYEYSTEFSA